MDCPTHRPERHLGIRLFRDRLRINSVVQKLPCIRQSLGESVSQPQSPHMDVHPPQSLRSRCAELTGQGIHQEPAQDGEKLSNEAFTGKTSFPKCIPPKVFTVA